MRRHCFPVALLLFGRRFNSSSSARRDSFTDASRKAFAALTRVAGLIFLSAISRSRSSSRSSLRPISSNTFRRWGYKVHAYRNAPHGFASAGSAEMPESISTYCFTVGSNQIHLRRPGRHGGVLLVCPRISSSLSSPRWPCRVRLDSIYDSFEHMHKYGPREGLTIGPALDSEVCRSGCNKGNRGLVGERHERGHPKRDALIGLWYFVNAPRRTIWQTNLQLSSTCPRMLSSRGSGWREVAALPLM